MEGLLLVFVLFSPDSSKTVGIGRARLGRLFYLVDAKKRFPFFAPDVKSACSRDLSPWPTLNQWPVAPVALVALDFHGDSNQ